MRIQLYTKGIFMVLKFLISHNGRPLVLFMDS